MKMLDPECEFRWEVRLEPGPKVGVTVRGRRGKIVRIGRYSNRVWVSWDHREDEPTPLEPHELEAL